jgi:osmotically-inducible protein OsmY
VAKKTPELLLGAPVRFQDRWTGTVTAMDVSEDWEVYNVAVRRGLFKPVTVRLPLEAATAWGHELLAFDETASTAAFGRDLPPIAAPSRTVSQDTPIAGGGRLAGLLVSPARRALAVLIERGGRVYRVPVPGVTFEGKTMHPGVQPEAIVPHYTEDDLRDRVKHVLATSAGLSFSEVQYVNVEATDDGVRLTGNVRSKQAREAAVRAVAAALGISVEAQGLVDDPDLEMSIGMALDRAGLGRTAQVSVRSVLGAVVLRGRGPSQAAADEVARAAARVRGVRTLANRIEVSAPAKGQSQVA